MNDTDTILIQSKKAVNLKKIMRIACATPTATTHYIYSIVTTILNKTTPAIKTRQKRIKSIIDNLQKEKFRGRRTYKVYIKNDLSRFCYL